MKRMVFRLGIVTLLLTVCVMAAVAEPPSGAQWTLIPSASDEFTGTALDVGKWKTGLWYSTSGVFAFKDSNVSVKDGCLHLSARKESYGGKKYTAAAVESRFDVPGTENGTRSYVEIRAKALSKRANVLSAIWLQSSPLDAAHSPNPEIDIMESFSPYFVSTTLHIWPDGTNDTHVKVAMKNWACVKDLTGGFHTYGLEREGTTLRFYFDGKQYWQRNCSDYPALAEMARHVVLSLEGHNGLPLSLFLPDSFQIDYVRTYTA